MIKTTYQTPELRDSNDNIVQEGAFGKNTALSNATNDGWIDYVVNNLEALHDTIGDSAATLDGNGHVVEPANLAIGDEDGLRIKTGYLKLTGGTVTGTTNFQQNVKFQDNQENVFGGVYVPSSSSTEQYAQFYGGESTGVAGAKLTLYPDGDGRFKLDARSTDGANTYTLVTDNNGNLNWRGYPLGWAKDYVRLDGSVKIPNALTRIASNLDPASSTRTEATAISLQDKNGTGISNLFSSTFVNFSFTGVRTMRSIDGTNKWADIRLVMNNNGTYHAEFNHMSGLSLNIAANSNNIPTTAWTDNKYLPMAGGTMTGSVVSSVGNNVPCMSMSTDNKTCLLCGGSVAANGARIGLNGKDTSADSGAFTITATDGTNTKQLKGYPNGDLTWNNNQLGLQKNTNNYIQLGGSASGNASHTFTFASNMVTIIARRGNNYGMYCVDVWDTGAVTMASGGTSPLSIAHEANSHEVTITNVTGSAVVVQIIRSDSAW